MYHRCRVCPLLTILALFVLSVFVDHVVEGNQAAAAENGLVGYWRLQGDCQDQSGLGNNGVNHGADLRTGEFNGVDAYIEVPASPSLRFGTSNFSISAWVYTHDQVDDIVGDIVDMYDPVGRRGITLNIDSSAGGYQSQGTDRHVHFGIDNAHISDWQDCGRPNKESNYVSNSLTVFKGKLYAATTDAADEADRCHVYSYDGGQSWTDCGHVGNGRTPGVGPMIVHNGDLYAVTWTYDWTRVTSGNYDPGRVYRYLGGTKWQDCGQPSDNRTLNCIASYQGKLYVGGIPNNWGIFVQDGDNQWQASKLFETDGPFRCKPHAMNRFNGKLYVAYPGVYSFDGNQWTYAGLPTGAADSMQSHSLTIYQGKLLVGTWPEAIVAEYQGGEACEMGRVGNDGTEVNSLVVYNGKLYGGSLPRSEVCRYDGDGQWTSLKRFYSPDDWDPGIPYKASRKQYNDWCRLTSLTVYDGKVFASTGSCTSSILDAPCDVRGKVFNMEAGKVASYDDDLGAGWKHLTAVRETDRLKLYIDDKLVAQSSPFAAADYDLSAEQPLRIGLGQQSHFSGKLRDLKLYDRALSKDEVAVQSSNVPSS